MKFNSLALAAAASIAVIVPLSAHATTATGDPALSTPITTEDNDGDDFPWGLLGLIGLAGLLGRKRDDRTDRTNTNNRM